MLKVYTYANCDTCRKALKFLNAAKIAHQNLPIRETPPSTTELKAMLKACDGKLRKLFNTSGRDYKALGLGAKLDNMSEAEALKLLVSNGNLVKRPFLIGNDTRLVGFKEAAWKTALL